MPQIIFIHADGRRQEIQAETGDSAMLTALKQGVDGIVGECGGGAVCATCHVYVDENWKEKLAPVSLDEDELLEGVAMERLPNSRLSCQIKITPELDGIVLRIPERQI